MTDWRSDFKRDLHSEFRAPLRLLFPPTCLVCRELVGSDGALCPSCWQRMRFLERPWCAVLGVPFAEPMEDGALSPEAIARPPAFARSRAAVSYVGAARRLVQALKYRDRIDLAPWLAGWMARAGAELLADADMIVPVPLHRRRFFLRQFNQSAELARVLARISGKPLRTDLVHRVRMTRRQVGLRAVEREDNVRGAFAVPNAAKAVLKGKRVLLVDDVFTTGATVSAVTRALLRAGAGQVDVLAFARAIPGDFLPGEAEPI